MFVFESLISAPKPARFYPIIKPNRPNYSAQSFNPQNLENSSQKTRQEIGDIRKWNMRDKEKEEADICIKTL